MRTPEHLDKKKDSVGRVRLLIAAALLFLFAVGLWLYAGSLAYRTYTLEAGMEFTASDLIKRGDPSAYFTSGSQAFDIRVPGEYRVKVRSGLFTHRATLHIQDTVAPTARAVTARLLPGETCSPEDLLSGVNDASQVTAVFASEPDYSHFGSQSVDLVLTDLGGNSTTVTSELVISRVNYKLFWEAGSPPPVAEDFLVSGQNVAFVTNVEALDLNAVADYDIVLSVDGEKFSSVLSVIDTTPPVAEIQDLTGYLLAGREAEDFIVSVDDATAVTAAFVSEPDLERPGAQELELLLTDEGGNRALFPVTLTLIEDTEPPKIAGIRDLTLLVGESLAYRKGLRVTDNSPGDVRLEIDSSGVNLNQEGTYKAIYTATDLAGNTATASIKVEVLPWEHSEDELNELADEVLDSILTEGMSQEEIVNAIYDYISKKISYVDHSVKGNWSVSAYQGLTNFRGDCFVFASTSKLLLTRAGIENMDIGKSDWHSTHYWNLIDIGDGWYHFDASPRTDGHPRIVLWTDEQLSEFCQSHLRYRNAYNYDKSQYPEIN